RTLAVEHVDPRKIELAFELARRYPESPEAEQGPPLVLRTGKSELATEIGEERLAELAQDDFHLGLVRELGVQSYMCVPLVAHGEMLGVISLVSAESGRRYGPDDLALAEELARRAARPSRTRSCTGRSRSAPSRRVCSRRSETASS